MSTFNYIINVGSGEIGVYPNQPAIANHKQILVTWGAGITNGSQGLRFNVPEGWVPQLWTASGTFGTGGNVNIEVSNDGVNWFSPANTLKTAPAVLTAAAPTNRIYPTIIPVFIRPNVTAGDGTTALLVRVCLVRTI